MPFSFGAVSSCPLQPAEDKDTAKAVFSRDENGTDIFRPHSRPNPFRGVLIRSYPSPDI
jgi:hypothetical protein